MIPIAFAAAVGLVLGTLVVSLRRRWVLVTVHGRSMVPALEPGDLVLVRRVPPAAVRVGQVVVVEEPVGGDWPTPPLALGATPGARRPWIVKRVAAVPGDALPAGLGGAAEPVVSHVPAGRFVLLGDNSQHSCDSRNFGFVPGDRILGSVRRVFRPLDDAPS